jgi:uncharacterized membrane-anchored protein YjiN (DUF445 family)
MIDFETVYDKMEDCWNELKRAEHSIYVSLKYTRTEDILNNIVNRLFSSLDQMIDILIYLSDIDEFNNANKTAIVLENYSDDEKINSLVKYFFFFQYLRKARSICKNEYRRHLMKVVELDNRYIYIVDIDSVIENYKLVKDFFSRVNEIIKEKTIENAKQKSKS